MITPEQEAAFEQYKAKTGFKPVSAPKTTYDSIDELIAQKQNQKQDALQKPGEEVISQNDLPGGWNSLSLGEKFGVTAHNIGATVAHGAAAAGTDVAGALGANEAADQQQHISALDSQYVSHILQSRKKAESAGQDTSHWDELIRNYKPVSDPSKTLAEMYPALAKSNEQVIGDFAELATELASAGSLETAGKAAVKPAGTIVGGILQGAKAGAVGGGTLGAAGGLAHGLQENKDAAGVLGETAIGGLEGSAAGGILGAVAGGVSAGVNKAKITAGVQPTIERHIATAKQIAEAEPNVSSEALIANTQKEMVAGLRGDGMTEASKAVSALNPADFSTVDEFGNAAKAATNKEFQKVQEIISPKLDAKEIKKAIAEGRIVPGQDPTLLKGGTPDAVLPSSQTARAAETVYNQIPGASSMKAPDLYTALGTKTSEHAQALRPAMQATPVTEDTVQGITDAWNALKAKQLDNPYIPTTANLERLQQNFERDFLQASKSDNLGDLWDTRIKYDKSVPISVRNATSLSSDTLQAQKEIWLQNRGILNDAIENASTGLDDVASKTFKEMSDMYNAQEGIISSYKMSKGELSRIADWIKKNPIKASAIGIALGSLTGLPQKAAGMAGQAIGL